MRAWNSARRSGGEFKRLFARLSVFVGSFTIEAAEALWNGDADNRVDTLNGVASLVDHSLIRATAGVEEDPRFSLLETIREFALEQLERSGQAEVVGRAHADYYLTLAERAHPELVGPTQVAWLDRLELEHDNFRAALRWAAVRGHAATGMRLSGALGPFWDAHGHLSEGRQWLEALLERDSEQHAAPRAKALVQASFLALRQNDHIRGAFLANASLAIYRALGDAHGVNLALECLGAAAYERGDYLRAEAVLAEGLAISEKLTNRQRASMLLLHLGIVRLFQGRFAEAQVYFAESVTLGRDAADTRATGMSLALLGCAVFLHGDARHAEPVLIESLALLRQVRDRIFMLYCLSGLGGSASALGDPIRTVRLLGAVTTLRAVLGVPTLLGELALQEGWVATVRAQLDEAMFTAAWAAGQAMTLEQVVAYALEECEIEPIKPDT